MLRRVLLAYGVLAVVVAVVLFAVGHAAIVAGVYLGVNGLLIVGALLFERGRYQPRGDRATGRWQLTGERFVDPTTGRLMSVRYNRDTGERDYAEAGEGDTLPRRRRGG